MTSPEVGIGQPKEYLGGHLAIGALTLVEAWVPIILYYSWQKSKLEKLNYNTWYSDSWKTMSYGGFVTYFLAFLFWAISFAYKEKTSFLYIGMLFFFGAFYGFYITAQTIIFQFQAIKNYSMLDIGLKKSEIWGVTGFYMGFQLIASFIGHHYIFDSIWYLLSAEIDEWCGNHPGVCDDYSAFLVKGSDSWN